MFVICYVLQATRFCCAATTCGTCCCSIIKTEERSSKEMKFCQIC